MRAAGRRRGGRRVTSGKKKKRRPAGSYRAPAAAPPPKRGMLDSLFSRPTGVSPMPKIRTTFARGLTTVLGAPVLVIAVPVVLLAEWAILLAFGFQGPFSLLSAVFGVPPISTYADVILSSSAFAPASGGGVGSSIGPLIGIVLFLTVNAAIHAWVDDRLGRVVADGRDQLVGRASRAPRPARHGRGRLREPRHPDPREHHPGPRAAASGSSRSSGCSRSASTCSRSPRRSPPTRTARSRRRCRGRSGPPGCPGRTTSASPRSTRSRRSRSCSPRCRAA